MKKNVTYTAALIVLLSLFCLMGLAGCADTGKENPGPAGESASPQGGAPADMPAEVRFAGFSAAAGNEQTQKNMLALFADAYPQITVIDESAGYVDYFTELAAEIGSGDAPDVFELDAAHIAVFSDCGAIQPLDEMASSRNSDLGIYQEGLLRLCKNERQLVALPFSYHTVMLIYNMDLFDAAGVDYPNSDWVWNDVLLAAQKIAKPEEDLWGYYIDASNVDEFYAKATQNRGLSLHGVRTAFTINTSQNVETLQWIQDLIWVYQVMPTAAELAGRSEYDLFAARKLGMFLGDTGMFADLRERCSDIRWGVAIEPGNQRKATQVFCNGLCVNSVSEVPDAAYTLAYFLTSDPGIQGQRLEAGWDLPPVFDPVVMDAYVQDTPPANKAAVLGSIEYSVPPIVIEDIDLLAEILMPHLKAVRDNEEIPVDALDAAQAEAERRISLPQE